MDRATMERLRVDLIRRARLERNGGEQDASDREIPNGQPIMQEANEGQSSRFLFGRPLIPRFLRRQQDTQTQQEEVIGSPKTPDGNERAPTFPRQWAPNTSSHRSLTTGPGRQEYGGEQALLTAAAPVPRGSFQSMPQCRIRTFDTPDPAEVHLAQLAEEGRMRRAVSQSQLSSRKRPRKFLFCLPHVRSRRVRTQILHCFVSGSFLILLLTIFLALSMTNNIDSREMTILLILVIFFGTVFFCHGLLRLVLLIARGDRLRAEQSRLPHIYAPMQGYAIPSRPIPVVLARDEEAVSGDTETPRPKPPAYGAWRESVRVDPDRLFWQRNESADQIPTRPGVHSGPRPPSYISEDGVSYVVEATPRSTVPTMEVPLPQHPSEVGRGTRMPMI